MILDRKDLNFFAIILLIIFGFFTILGGILFSTEKICIIYNPFVHNVTATVALENSELPLPEPSSITTEINQIRLDLEQVVVHKYFIVYSVIYGDQSHTAYHLFLTNLNKKPLDPDLLGEIWLESEQGEQVSQIAEPTVSGYPEDEPLGWKIGIIAKFPYKKTRSEHKLYLTYNGEVFELLEIRY